MSYYRYGFAMALAMGAMSATSSRALAVSYASNITKTGTTVNFLLNETADSLRYTINGGAPQTLDGSTIGAKTFNLGSASDTFSILAEKTAAVGYTIPTGATVPLAANGLSQDSPGAGYGLISDDANILTRYFSPRGIDINNNPNTANFGTAYISNSNEGTVTEASRLVGDGLYALRADQSDAFGYGDTAKNPLLPDGFAAFVAPSASSPFRVTVADNGELFVADWADVNGNLVRISPDLNTGFGVFQDFGGGALPPGRNHGSILTSVIEGSVAAGNLVVYTVDQDLTTNYVTGAGLTTDQNSLWKYEINGTTQLSTVLPTRIADPLIPVASGDLDRGADGKFYLTQYRSAGNEGGLYVTDASGAVLFDSLAKSRELLANPTAVDILRNIQGITISPDQKWAASILNGSDVLVLPLLDGIPDLAGRMVIDTGVDVASGRDIAFDAAGNIHYVSSGQGRYRVLTPGGHTIATTAWNGSSYTFGVQTVTAPPALAGDFNADNVVNGADFLVWQRGGSPNPLSAGDLDLWKAHFGEVGAAIGAVGAVPEPSSLAIGMLALVGFGAISRRRAG